MQHQYYNFRHIFKSSNNNNKYVVVNGLCASQQTNVQLQRGTIDKHNIGYRRIRTHNDQVTGV